MPRIAEAMSESEAELIHTGLTKKTYSSKKRRMSASESDADQAAKETREAPEDTTVEGDGEEEEEEEEEFEIEKILDAKKGQFPGGRMGYFVKWKGYGDEHNSWVDERDAGNAKEVIDVFWAEKKKSKTGPRKSDTTMSIHKSAEKTPKKPIADMESSAEPDGAAKKRGRPKKESLPSDKQGVRDGDESEQRVRKKPRKSNGHAGRDNKPESEDEEVLASMKKHMKVPSWEDLIESVDTVEREDDGELYVFFTLKDKKRVRESSGICAEKFPQKLIRFYESNLRWKTESNSVDAE